MEFGRGGCSVLGKFSAARGVGEESAAGRGGARMAAAALFFVFSRLGIENLFLGFL